jgi:hypothetical protein
MEVRLMITRSGVRFRAPAVPGLLALLLLSACGAAPGVATIDGADDATPSPSASAGSDDPEEAMFAFADCMREEGIDMPDPVIRWVDGSGGGGGFNSSVDEAGPGEGPAFDPNSEEFQEAQETCQHHLEGLGAMEPGDGPQLTPEEEEAFLAFTECMREHGIDMPDPGTGGAIRINPGSGDDAGFDPRSEEFQAAQEECRSHLEGIERGEPGTVTQ